MKATEIISDTPPSMESLRFPVKQDLEAVDSLLLKELFSHLPLIQMITNHIIQSGGKRLRPLIVLLSARACGYDQNTEHHELAAAIEFIHTATLLHDDVIDKSHQRRGKQTANEVWGNSASVLVGDFLYSRTFQILAKRNNIPVMKVLANTTNEIAEGEVWQLMNQNNPNVEESIYYEVVRRKTAQLFSAAAEVGAIVGTKNEAIRKAMASFGLHIGIAYQIIDDLLDYSDDPTQLDKNIGEDLVEGKATLPLIYAKKKANLREAELIREAIKNGGLEYLQSIMQIISDTKAREYTRQCATQEIEKAQIQLQQLPPSPFRHSLEALSKFVVSRQY